MKRARARSNPSTTHTSRAADTPARRAPRKTPPSISHTENTEALRSALEELQVAEEELRVQNRELQETRRELEQERQRYEEPFRFAPDAYLVTTPRGIIREANEVAAELFQAPDRFLLGKSLVVFVTKPFLREFRLALGKVSAHPVNELWEARLLTRTGSEFDAELKVSPVWDERGKPSSFRWLIRDISGRKRAAEMLAEPASLLHLTHDTIIVRDLDSHILFWNRGAEEMYGWKASKAYGQVTHALLRTQFPESREAVDEALLKNGRWEGELIHRRRDGTHLVVSSRQVLKRDSRGEPQTILELNTDITAQKKAEAELVSLNAELEGRVEARTAQVQAVNDDLATLAGLLSGERDILQTIMENTDTQIAYLDPQFNFIRVNSAYAKGSGYKPAELLRHNFFDLFPDAENRRLFEQVRETGEPVSFSAKPFEFVDQPERGVIYCNWTLVPVKNDAGHLQGMVLSLLDVTPTVRAQHALVESNLRIQSILSSITDAYAAFDYAWRMTDFNPAAERIIFHRGKQELVGKVFWDEFPKARGSELAQACERAVVEQHPIHIEARSVLADKWLETHIYPSRDGIRIYYRDITERKQEEETRARLAAIVESSDDAIIGLTTEGQVQSWNPGAERLFGYTTAEMVGQSVSVIYPHDHLNEFPGIVKQIQRGERLEHYETHCLRRDGSELDVSVSISPIRDASGQLAGAAEIVRDIMAEKRAREATRFLAEASAILASSLNYEATLERTARLALPLLADYIAVNIGEPDDSRPRVAAMAADPAHEEALRAWVTRTSPLAGPTVMSQVLKSGQPQVRWEIPVSSFAQEMDPETRRLLEELEPASSMIVPMIARERALGSILLVRTRAHRRYDAADLAVAEDLARRAAFAVDNARLYHESQAALVARDEFLSVASHEVRTPLTVIRGYTELLRRQAEQARDDPEGLVAYDRTKLLRTLENIDYSTGRLIALIGDLLDVSRRRERRMNVAPERVNLKEVIWGVVRRVQDSKPHREHLKNLDLQVDLPPEEIWGEWDRTRVEQLLANLVDNAIKYSTTGGLVQIRVVLEQDKKDGRTEYYAHLTVHDQGIGIPPEEMGEMFRPFVRASNATERHYPGLGLGLAVSKEIVNRHGGRIWVESEGRDLGSTFHIVLPMAKEKIRPEAGPGKEREREEQVSFAR